MRENAGFGWKKIGVEIFSIIFAVLLALVANEWRQNYSRHREVAGALELVRSEIIKNKSDIEASIANQKIFLDSLKNVFMKSGAKKELKDESFANIYVNLNRQIGGGLRFASVLSTAWLTAKELGILRDIDYDLAMKFSKMEEQSRQVNFRFQAMSAIFYGKDFFKKGEAMTVAGSVYVVLIDLMAAEQELINVYQEILDKLGKNGENIPAVSDSLRN